MGMGYAGASVIRIDESVIKRKCPNLLADFKALTEEYGQVTISDFLGYGESELNEDACRTIQGAYDVLVTAFKKKTGLDISYFYHNSEDDGDRYDDIGEAWVVNNAYQLTKAAKPYAKYIIHANFVQFG